jgi:hypothetical protein
VIFGNLKLMVELFPGIVRTELFGFEIVRKIGSGSSSDYYHVTKDGVNLAMRISRTKLDTSIEVSALNNLASLSIPAIISTTETDSLTHHPVTVTVYSLLGESLETIANTSMRARFCLQVLDILAQAHQRGQTHGRVKASKILILKDHLNRVALSGFGRRQDGTRMNDLIALSNITPEVANQLGQYKADDSNYLPFMTSLRDALKGIAGTKKRLGDPLPSLPKAVLLAGQSLNPEGTEAYPVTANTVLMKLLEIREGDGALVRHELSKVGGFSRVFPAGTEGGREALAVVGLLACLPQAGAINSLQGRASLDQNAH